MSTTGQPQNADPWNARSLNTLSRAIALSQCQFALILVRCNYISLRDRMIQQLHNHCPVPIHILYLPESATTLYTTIQAEIEQTEEQEQSDPNPPRSPQALMVLGLESVTAIEQVLVATNLVREELRKQFAFPLVLWVNDRLLYKLDRLAPDLKSWAGNTIIPFEMPIADLIQSLKHHSDRLFANVLNTGDQLVPSHWGTLSRRVYIGTAPINLLRPSELAFALKDVHSSSAPLDGELQANLDFLLGQEAHAQGEMETARECYERSLKFWQQISQYEAIRNGGTENTTLHSSSAVASSFILQPSSLERAACLLVYLGFWWRFYAVLQRVTYDSSLRLARDYFRQSLELFTQENRQDLVARFILPLAELLQKLKQWDELKALAKNALVLHKLYVDPVRQARDHGFLAEVALSHAQWTEATQQAETALQVLQDAERSLNTDGHPPAPQLETSLSIAHRYHLGWYLFLLARAQEKLGQIEAAIADLEMALHQSFPQDDPELYIQILRTLQHGYFEKGRYLEAFRTKQTQRSIEHQYGLRAFIGALRLEPQRYLLSSTLDQIDPQILLAQEIRASGRKKDVDQLIARLGRNDYKLTVIHGPSGVGKSSIVYAGLVPALSNRVIGDRIARAIAIDSYTNWQSVLQQQLVIPTGSQTTERQDYEQDDTASPDLLDRLRHFTSRLCLPVLIFDQFEEFFFAYDTVPKRLPFYQFLHNCLNLPFVKVILSLREDYLHYLLEFQRLMDLDIINHDILSKDIRYPLVDFSIEDTKSIIRSLTAHTPFYLADDLIEALVTDLAGELGEVRAIELQVVGAQLQAEGINTLAEYRQKGPKNKLVERSLETVVQDCGRENEQVARVVLFLLTNENGTRPLKTRDDLEADLVDLGFTADIGKLDDLVLPVLVGSGLVFLVPETPSDRYQLVHDYLVSFIRQQKQTGLLAELERERELRRFTEEELRQTIEKLEITLANEEFLTDSLSAEALLNSNLELEALLKSISTGIRLQQSIRAEPKMYMRTVAALRQVVYGVHERNRFQGHSDSVCTVCFSPDGKTIASGSADKSIKLWSLNGRELKTFQGHSGSVLCVRFSPDGMAIASGSNDNTVKLWSLDGRTLQTFEGHRDVVWSISISPDGTTIASGSSDRTIKLWSIDGAELQTLTGHTGSVLSVCFSPDGKTIASGSEDRTVRLWSLSGQKLKTIKGHGDSVTSVCFSPDGTMIASASYDTIVKLWRSSGQKLKTLKGHSRGVWSIGFSPESTAIASGSADNTIKLWSVDGQELQTLKGHRDLVCSVSFSPDGTAIASGSDDTMVKLWHLAGQPLQTLKGHGDAVWSVSFSPDGQTIASSSSDNTIKLWRMDGQLLNELKGHGNAVWSVSFSPDGQTIVSSSSDNTIKLWRMDGQELQTLQGHNSVVLSISVSPDGKTIAAGLADHTIKLWRMDGQELQTLNGHSNSVFSVCFSPDGQAIASGSDDNTVKLWRINGQEVRTFKGHRDWVRSVSFSPDGKTIASGSADNTVKVWSLNGKELQTLNGHIGSVWSVSFSPNGKTIASGSDDATVKLWSLDGQELQTLRGHTGSVWSVRFSPDGKTIASGSDDATVKLWNFDLDNLLVKGCSWLQDYLNTNRMLSEKDRQWCNGVRQSKTSL
jgi:WD40 repeat protein/tetratricopeptide (TPR) repeat protein